jgi:hypothetical protein
MTRPDFCGLLWIRFLRLVSGLLLLLRALLLAFL